MLDRQYKMDNVTQSVIITTRTKDTIWGQPTRCLSLFN